MSLSFEQVPVMEKKNILEEALASLGCVDRATNAMLEGYEKCNQNI